MAKYRQMLRHRIMAFHYMGKRLITKYHYDDSLCPHPNRKNEIRKLKNNKISRWTVTCNISGIALNKDATATLNWGKWCVLRSGLNARPTLRSVILFPTRLSRKMSVQPITTKVPSKRFKPSVK